MAVVCLACSNSGAKYMQYGFIGTTVKIWKLLFLKFSLLSTSYWPYGSKARDTNSYFYSSFYDIYKSDWFFHGVHLARGPHGPIEQQNWFNFRAYLTYFQKLFFNVNLALTNYQFTRGPYTLESGINVPLLLLIFPGGTVT